MKRMRLEVDYPTYDALLLLAKEERRTPEGQAEWMLRQAVKARLAQEQALRHLEGHRAETLTGEVPC